MAEYLSPGVYVEEIDAGPKPIEGVSTSTAGFLGPTERGPVVPQYITSFTQFSRVYGGLLAGKYLGYAIDGFFRNGGQRCFIGRIASQASAAAKSNAFGAFNVEAWGPGAWGNGVAVAVRHSHYPANSDLFDLAIYYWRTLPPIVLLPAAAAAVAVAAAAGAAGGGAAGAGAAGAAGAGAVAVAAAGVPAQYIDSNDPRNRSHASRREADAVEVYEKLSANPLSSDYYLKRVNRNSRLIRLEWLQAGRPTDVGRIEDPNLNGPGKKGLLLNVLLTGGTDGNAVALADYRGIDSPGKRTGLAAFAEIDEISLVAIPDEHSVTNLTEELIDHCEIMKDRFAVTAAAKDQTDVTQIPVVRDSKYAAVYYPWIQVVDPLSNGTTLVPPTGHVVGVYARSDTERGVHKAPANEVVRGALDLERPVSKGDQDSLNPRGINAIRSFPGRGIRIWGARTMSSDGSWKYINVRRLFNYVEESIDQGTQWVVFEPNDEKLWSRVRQSVVNFLTTVWNNGALMGTSAAQAFFVKCDYSTMTQDDIDNGRLICVIGIAPVKPAEFVIFRIQQKTLESGAES